MKKYKVWASGEVQIIWILLIVAFVALIVLTIVPFIQQMKEKVRGNSCASNQKLIAWEIIMYAQEHDEKLPSTTDFWDIATTNGTNLKILKCPKDNKKVQNSYGHNSSINGLKLENIDDPATVYLTADVLPGSNNILSIGNGNPRHKNGGILASHLDGHACYLKGSPASFVYMPNKLTKGLLKGKDIYTPNGKYNSAHWSLEKIGGDQRVAAGDEHSKMTYNDEYDAVTISAIGDNASAVAKVDLSAFYPKDIKAAIDYWAFDAEISFGKSISKDGVFTTRVAVIFLDENEKVIAALYALRGIEDDVAYNRVLLNYDNNNTFQGAQSKINPRTIILHDERIKLQKNNHTYNNNIRQSAERFAPFSVAARDNILYVSCDKWYDNTKISLGKANWKKPTTLKIVCFENDSKDAVNAIELKSPSFVIK